MQGPWDLEDDFPDDLCYRCWQRLPEDAEGDLCNRCKGPDPEPIVRAIWELAEHLGEAMLGEPFEAVCKRVARRLYKATSCGISFYCPEGTPEVVVAGYCEGTDRECPAHTLTYPFFLADFHDAVDQADQEGCDLWDETHGCEDCATFDEFGSGEKPVDPNCKTCGGQGEVR